MMKRNRNIPAAAVIGLFILGMFFSGCNRDDKARQKLAAMKNDPQVSAYALRLAEMSYLTGRRPDKTYSYTLIRDLIKDGYFSEARYAVDHLVDTYGPDAGLYYYEAVCYRNQHEYSQALSSIKLALDLDGNDQRYSTEKSNILTERGRWMAIDSLNNLLRVNRHDYRVMVERAVKLLGMREFEAAIYDADTVLHADSSNLQARFVRGLALLLDGRYSKALPEFETLSRYTDAPDAAEYRQYLEIASALKENSDMADQNPTSPTPYVNMARALARMSEFTNAIEILDKGLSRIPGNVRLEYAKALVYLQSGNKQSARELVYKLESKGVKIDAAVKKAVE